MKDSVPGEQGWAVQSGSSQDLSVEMDDLTMETRQALPSAVHTKYPLPGKNGRYLGALIKVCQRQNLSPLLLITHKVYDDVSFKPASTHTFTGILSKSPMPSTSHLDDAEEGCIVPTIHVITLPSAHVFSLPPSNQAISDIDVASDGKLRSSLIDYLATAFEPPDRLAGEYLLLLLISAPTARPPMLPPIGTLAVNFIRSSPSTTLSTVTSIISSVSPAVVPLDLTIPLLHSANFVPVSADSSSLDAGLLQLSKGTVLVVGEDGMGEGGTLNEKAMKNLKSLGDCISQQTVPYEYPYIEPLRMDCHIRVAVLSEGKSLLPVSIDFRKLPLLNQSKQVDVRVPLKRKTTDKNDDVNRSPPIDSTRLSAFRDYLAVHASSDHSAKFVIPDDVTQRIQDEFVRSRQTISTDGRYGGVNDSVRRIEEAEDNLKRQMRVAR